MTLLDSAKRLLGKGGVPLATRVEGLEHAVEAAQGRLEGPELEHAEEVVARAGTRLRLSADHTVVAIGGATGSGKSSTFNALTGLDLAAVGVRRPTTSWTMACVWGESGAGPLLDWLEIPHRHRVTRDSMLDQPGEENALHGLVLLDLPDHDSTEVSHHLEVERLVTHSDLLVWVLDPQKYADAAIHDRYLKPLAGHAEVMLVVLNHIDEVPESRREAMIADCRRLLDADGLQAVPLVVTSAHTGVGIPELRDHIVARVGAKDSRNARLLADVLGAAEELAEVSGTTPPSGLSKQRRAEVVDACVDAAGVPAVVEAVRGSVRSRGARATGWPLLSWLPRRRTDPLQRLQQRAATAVAPGEAPTEATTVRHARVATTVRETVDEVTQPLTPAWTRAVRRVAGEATDRLDDELTRVVAMTPEAERLPTWTRVLQVAQTALFLAALAGGGWLVALAVMGFLQTGAPTPPEAAGLPLPTLLLLGGVAAGVALAVLGRLLVGMVAGSRARRADRRLRKAVREVAERTLLGPVDAELEACRVATEGLASATR
ncbi:MAG: GTPase [Nocardioides sp.]|nr:GTPase [Nocardioides sp.]